MFFIYSDTFLQFSKKSLSQTTYFVTALMTQVKSAEIKKSFHVSTVKSVFKYLGNYGVKKVKTISINLL